MLYLFKCLCCCCSHALTSSHLLYSFHLLPTLLYTLHLHLYTSTSPSHLSLSLKMANYWKSKVLPRIKKVFENPKKAAALEACKAFDESKEEYSKEFEEKKSELEPKVTEIYEASSTEIKALIKDPKEPTLKKHSAAVQKFLDELAKIEFPGSKPVSEAATKVGPGYLSGPVFFVFEKVSTFVVTTEEEKKEEAAPPAEVEAEKTEAETSGAEVKEEVAAPPAEAPPAEEPKVEAAPPAAAEPPKP